MNEEERKKKIEKLAKEILSLTRDNLVVSLRFLDVAIISLVEKSVEGFWSGEVGKDGLATDGEYLYYDPQWVLSTYQQEPNLVARSYLHVLLHLVFFHSFQYDKLEQALWDMATDIAVENTIISLNMPSVEIKQDQEIKSKLEILSRQVDHLTAEYIYRHLRINGMSSVAQVTWRELYHRDAHLYWLGKEEHLPRQEKWRQISQRVSTELKNFSDGKALGEELQGNLKEATRERVDYGMLLQRFVTLEEEMQVNDDEFDYIYYTYGLQNYGDMPLIEPLEYKDAHKVKEFVIALDTSASCRGEIIQGFLNKTYGILSAKENYFHKINVHIIQCDNEVQMDHKITSQEEFREFCNGFTLKGFGNTDFRPVFHYVEKLRKQGEFENLKGMIYFTDGFGIYPESMPDYSCIFAFLKEEEQAPPIPPWAYKVILEEDELENHTDF